jgi:hypothetical protein
VRRTLTAAAAVAAAGLLGACAALPQGDHRWVQNSKEGMFVRIPREWRTYTINPYDVNTERPAPLRRATARWSMVLDSSPAASKAKNKTLAGDENKKSSIKALRSTFPRHLIAEMSVQPMTSDWTTGDPDPTLREAVSIGFLGNGAVNGDPVKDFMGGDPNYEVVSYKEVARKDGLWGADLRINFQVEPFKWVTVDQHILINRSRTKMYRLLVKCESSCFKRNYGEAKRLASTWTVKQT